MTALATDISSLPRTADGKRHARDMTKAQLRKEVEAMSEAMVQEQGLLNHAQAGIILDVSTRRVGELVALMKLKRFDFLGRTYVSMREVKERREMDLKAGRPPRNLVQKIVASVKCGLNGDAGQLTQGGYTDFAARLKERELKKRKK